MLVNDPAADTQENDTQSETAVARVGNGPKLVATFNDSGSLGVGSSVHFTGYATSSDDGATWVDRGALPESDFGDVGDPSITYLAKNNSVVVATLTCGDTECGAPGYGAQIFRSSDAGVSFATPVLADFGADAVVDKEWIAADNFAGSASSGAGNLYLMARDFGAANAMRLTRSVDGGATWSAPIAIASGGQGAYVLVGPDHSVYGSGSATRTCCTCAGRRIRVHRSDRRPVSGDSPTRPRMATLASRAARDRTRSCT